MLFAGVCVLPKEAFFLGGRAKAPAPLPRVRPGRAPPVVGECFSNTFPWDVGPSRHMIIYHVLFILLTIYSSSYFFLLFIIVIYYYYYLLLLFIIVAPASGIRALDARPGAGARGVVRAAECA